MSEDGGRGNRAPMSRSENMARIRSKDTAPELSIRSSLHRLGFRFRLHRRDFPGKPDLVFPKYRAVVFVHGCFWHQHKGCRRGHPPKSNIDYWIGKLSRNVERDRLAIKALRAMGWTVITVWECQITRSPGDIGKRVAKRLKSLLTSQ